MPGGAGGGRGKSSGRGPACPCGEDGGARGAWEGEAGHCCGARGSSRPAWVAKEPWVLGDLCQWSPKGSPWPHLLCPCVPVLAPGVPEAVGNAPGGLKSAALETAANLARQCKNRHFGV